MGYSIPLQPKTMLLGCLDNKAIPLIRRELIVLLLTAAKSQITNGMKLEEKEATQYHKWVQENVGSHDNGQIFHTQKAWLILIMH